MMKHRINTVTRTPVTCKPRRISVVKQQIVDTLVEELPEIGMIYKSATPSASPIVLVLQCIDYRDLNAITKKDSYPLPRIEGGPSHAIERRSILLFLGPLSLVDFIKFR